MFKKIAAVILILAFGGVVLAETFTGPSLEAPFGNTAAPVNDSFASQVKAGGLSLGSLIVNGGSYFVGNMGIGTISPTSALHVIGEVNATNFLGDGSGVTNVDAATVGGYPVSELVLLNDENIFTENPIISAESPDLFFETDSSSHNWRMAVGETTEDIFEIAVSTTENEGAADDTYESLLAITENGNVGIGTTSLPTEKLEVAGAVKSTGVVIEKTSGANNTSNTGIQTSLNTEATINVTSYDKAVHAENTNYIIDSGVTDSGYKIGVEGSSYAGEGNLDGTLNSAYGVWARSGIDDSAPGGHINNAYALYADLLSNDSQGSITNAYSVFIDNGSGDTSITNNYAIYQTTTAAKNYFAGNVGIGTTAPGRNLSISSATASTFQMTNSSIGVASGDGTLFQSLGSDFYIKNQEAGIFRFGTNDLERMRITSDGNVGIGVTNPSAKLHVANTTNAIRMGEIRIEDTNEINNEEGSLYLQHDGANDLIAVAGGGNVGIGTYSPSSKLDVAGTVTATAFVGDGSGLTGLQYLPLSGGVVTGTLLIGSNQRTQLWECAGGGGCFSQNNAIGTRVVQIRGDGEDIYFNHTGNVGIGTESPDVKFEVKSVTGDAFIDLTPETNLGTGTVSSIRFWGEPGKTNDRFAAIQMVNTGGTNQNELSFVTNYSDSGTYHQREAMRIDDQGRVGIGITSPSSQLDVAGTVKATSFEGDGSGLTGITTKFIDGTDADDAVYTAGNVGIGTTAPGTILDITKIQNAESLIRLKNNRQDLSNVPIFGISANNSSGDVAKVSFYRGSGGNTGYLTFSTKEDNALPLTERLRIDSSGNVGIGTTSPTEKLDVAGTITATAFEGDGSGLTGLATKFIDGTDTDDAVYTAGNVGIGTATPTSGYKLDVNGNIILSSANAEIRFNSGGGFISNAGTANTLTLNTSGGERLRVNSSGNVGIGTTSPSSQLDVAGTITATAFEGDGSGLTGIIRDYTPGDWEVASSTQSSVYSAAALEVREYNNGGAQSGDVSQSPRIAFHWGGRVASQIGMGTNGSIRTYDNPGTGYEDFEAKEFQASGWYGRTAHNNGGLVGSYNNVGANSLNTNPIYVIGSSYKPDSTTLSNMYGVGYTYNSASFLNGTDLGTTPGSGWGMYVAADGNARIFLDASVGRIYAKENIYAASFLHHSDERLKKDIITIENSLEKIIQLRGVNFNWKKSGEREIGFIAQEVERVLPELVDGDETKSVKYANITAILVEAIKEQQKQINALQKEVEKLQK